MPTHRRGRKGARRYSRVGDALGIGMSFVERGMLTGWSLFMD